MEELCKNWLSFSCGALCRILSECFIYLFEKVHWQFLLIYHLVSLTKEWLESTLLHFISEFLLCYAFLLLLRWEFNYQKPFQIRKYFLITYQLEKKQKLFHFKLISDRQMKHVKKRTVLLSELKLQSTHLFVKSS